MTKSNKAASAAAAADKSIFAQPPPLRAALLALDGAPYSQLKSLAHRTYTLCSGRDTKDDDARCGGVGGEEGGDVRLRWLHIQSDPYAPGSTCEVTLELPRGVAEVVRLPPRQFGEAHPLNAPRNGDDDRCCDRSADGLSYYNEEEVHYYTCCRQTAAEDFLLRRLWLGLDAAQQTSKTSYYSYEGALHLAKPSSFIVPRSAVQLHLAPSSPSSPSPQSTNGKRNTDCKERESAGHAVRFCFAIKMPGHGRRIDGRGAWRILEEELAFALAHSVLLPPQPQHALLSSLSSHKYNSHYIHDGELLAHVNLNHNTAYLRRYVTRRLRGIAFVANGSCLPRAQGNSALPLRQAPPLSDGEAEEGGVVPFLSPPSLQVTIPLPNPVLAFPSHHAQSHERVYEVSGMLLPRGLTLIAGGGYHGKSTLLHALSTAVYNAAAVDGRSYCVMDDMAVAVRAEEGRSVQQLDVSLFLQHLPRPTTHSGDGRGTTDGTNFSTQDASGSTSEAAAMLEAIEVGARTLLLDEDTSASNLLVRDARMAALVPRASEPIRTLREQLPHIKYQQSPDHHHHHHHHLDHDKVSLVMVVGGSGSYFDVADVVLVLDGYCVRDSTAEAHAIAAATSLTAENEHVRRGGKDTDEKVPSLSSFNATRAFHYGSTFAPFFSSARGSSTNKHLQAPSAYMSEDDQNKSKYANRPSPPPARQQRALPPLKITAHRRDTLQLTHTSNNGYHNHTRGRTTTTTETVDVSALTQLVEDGQLTAIAAAVALLYDSHGQLPQQEQQQQRRCYPPSLTSCSPSSFSGALSLHQTAALSPFARLMYTLEGQLRLHALEPLRPSPRDGRQSSGGHPLARGAAVLPRVVELAAVLNRLRCLRCRR